MFIGIVGSFMGYLTSYVRRSLYLYPVVDYNTTTNSLEYILEMYLQEHKQMKWKWDGSFTIAEWPMPSLKTGAVARSERVRLACKRPRVRSPRPAYSFVETWSWKISTAILPLPLTQEEQLSVTGERILVNCLGGLSRNSVVKVIDRAGNYLKCVEGL